jgi:RND family efflux transporter MFP subunit
MPVATCPSREELIEYAVGKLADEAADTVASHLDDCPSCQAELAALPEPDDTLVARLRDQTPSDPYLHEPGCGQAVARAQAVVGDCPDFRGVAGQRDGKSDSRENGTVPFESLGEYQLIQRLGGGGMGTVYKARQGRLDRIVALKILSRGRTDDPRAIVRFEREMKAIGRLDHAHIVRAYDAREIDGTAVLIMEFVDGLDLAEIVRRTIEARRASEEGDSSHSLARRASINSVRPGIAVPDACELVRQTALALQCAHEHGLVHRDIKPSNIMLARSGEVKLLDLGLARFFAEGGADVPSALHIEETTGSGQAMGTADYMAPEQAADSRTVDIRADIYSLGCTLYKLLTGRAPFSGPEYCATLDKMNAHVHKSVPPVRSLAPDVPAGLAAIVERMLAKNPADRFATPAEVVEAIGPFCTGADLRALLTRALASPPLPPADGRREGDSLPSPSRRGAGGEGGSLVQPASRSRWKRFAGQLVLLALVGGICLVLGIILRIHKDGKTTTVKLEDRTDASVSPDGQVDIKLPEKAGGAAINAPPTTSALETTAPPKVAAVQPITQSTPDYLETTGKIIADKPANGTAGPVKLLQFNIDRPTFARMLRAAQKRNARTTAAAADDPFAVDPARAKPASPPKSVRPKSSAINWARILHIYYGYETAGEKDFPCRAEVKSLTDHFDPNATAVPCTATIGESDTVAAPGTSVRVRLDSGTTHDTLALPNQAIFSDGGKRFVYVGNDDSAVEPRAVEAGESKGGFRPVTGLNRNDIVIADPAAVKPGMAVKPDLIAGALQSPSAPIEFVETPLKDIVEYLQECCHVQIQIDDRSLKAAGIKPEVEITMNIRDVSLASALRLLLRSVGLTYVVEDGYILVTVPGKEKESSPNAATGPALKPPPASAAPLPVVRVTQPVVCDVSDYEEYTGRIEEGVVRIRHPVRRSVPNGRGGRGSIEKVFVGEGATVREGDLLAEVIDEDNPKLQQAREALHLAESHRQELYVGPPRASAKEDAKRGSEAEAAVKSAQEELDRVLHALPPAKIFAPISGKLSDSGLGGRGESPHLPSTIISPDSVIVTFDIDEHAILAHRRMTDRKPGWELSLPVVCGLADDKGFPYRGKVISVAEGINPSTHTQRWQALVKNQDGIFLPSMSVRVRLITSGPHKVTLIPNDAETHELSPQADGLISAEVYVVTDRNVIASRAVKIGRQYDGFVSVREGLRAADWVRLTTPDGGGMGGVVIYAPGTTVQPEKTKTPPPPWASISVPPSVSVAHPVVREVTDYWDFTGHMVAAQTAEIRPRVAGALVKVHVKPGMAVKQGDLLFEIDPRLYQAEVDQAAGSVKEAKIRRDARAAELDRMKGLLKTAAVSQEQFDQAKSQSAEAEAALQTAEAAVKTAQVRLEFTRIAAPFAGKIGGPLLDEGNLATADNTVLARLDSTDPMRLVFDIDERTALAMRRKAVKGDSPKALALPVWCGVAGDTGYPYPCTLDSVESQVNPASGTVRCRAVLANKEGLFVPGMFARVRLATSGPYKALLVPPESFTFDRGQAFVLVVNDQNVAERRDVEYGPMQDDRLRVIRNGVKAEDEVVTTARRHVQPGMAVTPEKAAIREK